MERAQQQQWCRVWLREQVFPLWSKSGFDHDHNCFYEALELDGSPTIANCRTMVQARQIYSFYCGYLLDVFDQETVTTFIDIAANRLVDCNQLKNGSFAHALHAKGEVSDSNPDLYAQAFAMFGLAYAFKLLKNPKFKDSTERLIRYLKLERSHPVGGFSELKNSQTLYVANPHMHLFEASLAWQQFAGPGPWTEVAHDIYKLCIEKFIDPKSGFLCEYFDESWQAILEDEKFIWEPGHHCEWSWLLGHYDKLFSTDSLAIRKSLVHLAEQYGLCPNRKVLVDEMWSDRSIKTATARFWPQGERVKVCRQLARSCPDRSEDYNAAADEAMSSLILYLEAAPKGMWFDRMYEDGNIKPHNAKGSSLYHIINAIEEYLN